MNKMGDQVGTHDEKHEVIIQDEIDNLVNLILSHGSRPVQDFLRSKALSFSGTREELKKSLKNGHEAGKLTYEDLTSLLHDIEEYGNQQVYLFNIPPPKLDELRNDEEVKNIFKRSGLLEYYNDYKPFISSEEPMVFGIDHDYDWIKIRWGITKEEQDLIEEKRELDDNGNEILIKNF